MYCRHGIPWARSPADFSGQWPRAWVNDARACAKFAIAVTWSLFACTNAAWAVMTVTNGVTPALYCPIARSTFLVAFSTCELATVTLCSEVFTLMYEVVTSWIAASLV